MNSFDLYRVSILSGRKAGASYPVSMGEFSIGTTLDSDFFIGSADMWHQLLRRDSSVDLRSASAAKDVVAEQLMKVTIKRNLTGLLLRVDLGFVEIGNRRLLPGDGCAIVLNYPMRIGSTQFEIQATRQSDEDDIRSQLRSDNLIEEQLFSKANARSAWLSQSAAIAVATGSGEYGVRAAFGFNHRASN